MRLDQHPDQVDKEQAYYRISAMSDDRGRSSSRETNAARRQHRNEKVQAKREKEGKAQGDANAKVQDDAVEEGVSQKDFQK